MLAVVAWFDGGGGDANSSRTVLTGAERLCWRQGWLRLENGILTEFIKSFLNVRSKTLDLIFRQWTTLEDLSKEVKWQH